MLYEIMRHCRNFFPGAESSGAFEIKDGEISLPFVLEGQYFLIEGSVFNDGLHKKPAEDLKDEKFEGRVVALKVPAAFEKLAEEIKTYCEKNPENGLQSESFGGYSYTRATANGKIANWEDVFASRLSDWRRI